MTDFIDVWGPKLLGAAIVYTVVSMIVVYGFASVGLEVPPIVPGKIVDLYQRSYELWSRLSGRTLSAADVASLVLDTIGAIFDGLMAFTFNVAGAFIALAVVVSGYLPEPLTILRIPVWVAAFMANTVLLLYLLRRIYNTLRGVSFPFG